MDWSDDTTPATTLAIVFASKGGDPPELAIITRLTPKHCIIKRMDVRTHVCRAGHVHAHIRAHHSPLAF